jgi:hypothetical protein
MLPESPPQKKRQRISRWRFVSWIELVKLTADQD